MSVLPREDSDRVERLKSFGTTGPAYRVVAGMAGIVPRGFRAMFGRV